MRSNGVPQPVSLRASKSRTLTPAPTTTNNYVWDTSGGLPDLLTDGENYYLYGTDHHPFAQINISTQTISYLHLNINGSTIATTDASGARTGTWTYDAYGNITAHTGITTPYTFAGEYLDTDTGLTYLRARDYDPTTGSFLTRDPLESRRPCPTPTPRETRCSTRTAPGCSPAQASFRRPATQAPTRAESSRARAMACMKTSKP
jgi:RHS repeat-associated protein